MGLLSMKYLSDRRRIKRNNNLNTQLKQQRQINNIKRELMFKLAEHLEDNESMLIEVDKNVVVVFLDILDESVLSLYDYKQIDKTKFIFSNKEIDLSY